MQPVSGLELATQRIRTIASADTNPGCGQKTLEVRRNHQRGRTDLAPDPLLVEGISAPPGRVSRAGCRLGGGHTAPFDRLHLGNALAAFSGAQLSWFAQAEDSIEAAPFAEQHGEGFS